MLCYHYYNAFNKFKNLYIIRNRGDRIAFKLKTKNQA
jgi:hypothetical protein